MLFYVLVLLIESVVFGVIVAAGIERIARGKSPAPHFGLAAFMLPILIWMAIIAAISKT